MLMVIVLFFSVLLQVSAAFYALRYIKITRNVFSWTLISAALVFMTVRRLIPLYHLIFTSLSYPVDLFNEWIGFILSLMMFLGVRGIGRIFIERLANEKKISYLATFPELDPNAICEIDITGSTVYRNPASLELEKKGIRCPCYFGPEEIKDIYSQKDKGGIFREIKCGDTWYFQAVHPLSINGNIRIYNIDITERKKAEEELLRYKDDLENMVREKTEQLKRTYKKLEDAKRLSDIGMLAATLAHELRNPLGVIRSAVYNIKIKSNDGSLDSHLANIDKKIEESDQIIRNFLSYSKINIPLYEDVGILDILKICAGQVRNKYPKWDVELKTKFNCPPGCTIEADPTQLNELFCNILDNAYQAFPDKKGTIEISLDYYEKENAVNITIYDDGIGIEEEDLSKIGQPFFTTKAHGIGLGLMVCKQVVGLHKGKFDIRSEKKKGTTVVVSLPVRRQDDKNINH